MEHVSLRQNTSNEVTPRYSSMQKSELEVLAIAAIHEHRNLLAADAAVYEEWTCANDDPTITSSVLRSLQDEYLAASREVRGTAAEALRDHRCSGPTSPEVPVG